MILVNSGFSTIMNPTSVKLLQAIFLVLLLQVVTLIAASSRRDSKANTSCIEKERQALLAVKQDLVDKYSRLSSWHEGDRDCCNWSGIHCNNQTGHVDMLDLKDNGGLQPLRGNISSSLMDLQYLELLDLSWNDFEGKELPEFFGSLTNLKYLYLSQASFGGKIPYQLGKLPRLQILHLHFNYLVGAIPCQFGNLSSLQELLVNDNNLGGVIPYQLGNLSTLVELSLGDNAYLTIDIENSTNVEWLSQLSSLVALNFDGVKSILNKPKRWLEMVQLLPNLQILSLINCSLLDTDILLLSTSQFNSSNPLKYLFLSHNMLTTSIFNWVFNLSLVQIELDQNLLQGPFPNNFGKLTTSLHELSLYDNQLNGTIPKSLGLMSKLQYLDVEGNHLEGVITDIQLANLTTLEILHLSRNSLTMRFSEKWIPPFQLVQLQLQSCKVGPAFPKWLQMQKNLEELDLSNVGISDSASLISFLCTASESLSFLNLSYNHLTGQIPNCWGQSKFLRILDLSNNEFSGNIPTSMGTLVLIRHLVLRNNKLASKLPSLANCTDLVLLDIGGNELSGTIPPWIGSNLHQLQVLSMGKNNFYGVLSQSLCHLTSIQLLDLSYNNLFGEIPKCLQNFSSMAHKHNLLGTIDKFYTFDKNGVPQHFYEYNFFPLVRWKGKEVIFHDNKRLLNLIDLSHNHMSGKIPAEIGNLVGLVSLDFSSNNLSGEIPSQFGNLQNLDFLNLSRNHLSGRIPTNLSEISRIGVLELSNNNLSGKIPSGTQLQSFDASAYEGNPYLCGRPLKSCSDETTTGNPLVHNYRKEEHTNFPFTQGFYISMGLGYFLGFWGIFGSLLLFRLWRHTYFNFLNNLMERIYVLIVIKVAKCRRWLSI